MFDLTGISSRVAIARPWPMRGHGHGESEGHGICGSRRTADEYGERGGLAADDAPSGALSAADC
jgi:hypothetical protein